MKTLISMLAIAVLAVGCGHRKEAGDQVRRAAQVMPSEGLPFEVGRAKFASGDSITVTSVESAENEFRAGGTYTVRGTYKLASAKQATLLFGLTSSDPKAAVAKYPDTAQVTVPRGEGKFSLTNVFLAEGKPHVSFYPADGGTDIGGIYFGEGEWLEE